MFIIRPIVQKDLDGLMKLLEKSGYGLTTLPQDSEVLKALRDDRADATAPGNSAHGETTGDDAPRE